MIRIRTRGDSRWPWRRSRCCLWADRRRRGHGHRRRSSASSRRRAWQQGLQAHELRARSAPCGRSSPGRHRQGRGADDDDWSSFDPSCSRRRPTGSRCSRSSSAPRTGSPRTSTASTAARLKCGALRAEVEAPRWTPFQTFVGEARRPLRARRRVLDPAPRGAQGPDPRLADPQRAELEELLPAEAEPEGLREGARGRQQGDQRPRPVGADVVLGGMAELAGSHKAIRAPSTWRSSTSVKGRQGRLRRRRPAPVRREHRQGHRPDRPLPRGDEEGPRQAALRCT